MKRFNINIKASASLLSLLIAFGSLFTLQSCKEEIDESNFAIKEGQTVTDYMMTNEEVSEIYKVLQRVRLGSKTDASPIANVLSARGNYTCFLPTNEAVLEYVRSVTGTDDVNNLSDEQAELIAYNCIIDNGDNSAYETPDFPVSGAFGLPNLSDRLIDCQQDSLGGYVVNKTSQLIKSDIEATNGIIHIVDKVIAPSLDLVSDMVLSATNMKIMGTLIQKTGWCDSLTEDLDLDFETAEHPESRTFPGVGTFTMAQQRYLGYTGFIETDDVLNRDWGISMPVLDEEGNVTNWEQILSELTPKCEAVYGTEALGDITNPDNAVNKFLSYHFMKGKYAYNQFVHHFNELGYKYGSDVYNPQERDYTLNVWDYFPMMGKMAGLLKITQVAEGEHDIYINRVSIYDLDTYSEIGTKREGIRILSDNGGNDNNSKNGFFHPIDGILLYDDATREALGSERIRFDVTTIFPELTSNSFRGKGYKGFENGYFENIFNESANTQIYYLVAPTKSMWHDYQGDEFLMCGVYDFIVRLPRVPVRGTYELRMGISQNSLRGMAQVYFGSDPQRLQPTGLPVDMRQAADNNPAIPWVADGDDESANREVDKQLRNQGYMKAPNYFEYTNGTGEKYGARHHGGSMPCLRRIITTQTMDPNETYYIRFKSVLESTTAQFFLDYFEYAPSSVYNGTEPEDIW